MTFPVRPRPRRGMHCRGDRSSARGFLRPRSSRGSLRHSFQDELERAVITEIRPVNDSAADHIRCEILADEEMVVLVRLRGAPPERSLLLAMELAHAVAEPARRETVEKLGVVR